MTTPATLALRSAIFERLKADSTLMDLLGEGGVYDHPPRNARFPNVSLESAGSRPLLEGEEAGLLHDLKLVVHSRQPSSDETHILAARITDLLMQPGFSLQDHHLVGLQITSVTTRLLRDGRSFKGELSLRAVTEPAMTAA
ncbi:MAG: DUF3168 domain-containing protein [Rhodobacteraceae bacterium]|nr:DUF3168 domain-containing protein [Paracoccaceae bacterium]